ncbi:MAG: hypothetical protein ABW123_18085 [Cystobacter sp.]
MNRLTLLASTSMILLLGCAARQTPPALCAIDVAREKRPILSAEDWFALLLHGFDREQRTLARPTLDCSGSPVVWQEPVADECREAGPDAELLPMSQQLTDEDLVMTTLRADLRLVWVIARRYANGEALGPVGLVERTDQGIVVRALGSLRSFPLQSQLRLEQTGNTTVLVAEGEQCTLEGESVCRRFARLLPLRNGRFFSESVTGQDGKCLGPAWFPLSRQQLLQLPGGMQRKVELTSNLKFTSEGIFLNEEVAMHDLNPKNPSMPPRPYRRAQSERKLRVEGTRLVGTDASMWVRLMELQLLAGNTPISPSSTAQAKDTP